ncbi:MAG: choice-of-anchor X domain-containing protein [Oscillochloridaceae bacterium umkhey_bin13]
MPEQTNYARHWWLLATMILVISSVGWSAAPAPPPVQAETTANSGAGLSYSADGRRYRFEAAAPGAAVTPQKLGQAAPRGSIPGPGDTAFWIEQEPLVWGDWEPEPQVWRIMQGKRDGSGGQTVLTSATFYATQVQSSLPLNSAPMRLVLSADAQKLYFGPCRRTIIHLYCDAYTLQLQNGQISAQGTGVWGDFTIAPDGQRVFHTWKGYCDQGGTYYHTYLSSPTGTITLGTGMPGAIVWLPDGRLLFSMVDAWTCDNQTETNRIRLAAADGSFIRDVALEVLPNDLLVSPDEQTIAYTTDVRNANFELLGKELWLIGMDGTGQRKLADLPADASDLRWEFCLAGRANMDMRGARGTETFAATNPWPGLHADGLTCTFEIPVARFFGGTLPGAATRPEAIAASNGVRLRFAARSSRPVVAQIYLNNTLIGAGAIGPTVPAGCYGIDLTPQLRQDPNLLRVAPAPGFIRANDQPDGRIVAVEPPQTTPNQLSIVGPDDLVVEWAELDVYGAMKPIIFVHGWTGDETTFREFADWADRVPHTTQNGQRIPYYADDIPHFPVEALFFDLGIRDFATTVARLKEYVRLTKIAFGSSQVNLVGHSRGGVVIRLAFNDPKFANHVANVITISSPHHGTDAMWFASAKCIFDLNPAKQYLCNQAAMALTTSAMRATNYGDNCRRQFPLAGPWIDCQKTFTNQEQAARTLSFAALSGSSDRIYLDIEPYNATLPWRNSCERQPTADGTYLDRPKYWLSHTQTNSDIGVYIDTIELLRDGSDRVLPWTPYACPGTASALRGTAMPEVAQASVSPDFRPVEQISGELVAAATTEADLRLSSGEDLQIILYATNPLSLSLRNPQGTIITPAPQGSVSADEPGIRIYALPAVEGGTWQLRLTNEGSATVDYSLAVETRSPLALEAVAERPVVTPGTPVTLHARLIDGQRVLSSGVIMQVSIEPDGPQFTMRDDGQAGDLVANDGQFAVTLPGFAEARYHSLSVSASWPEGQRKEIVVVAAAADLVTFDSLGEAYAAEPDRAGRWQSLIVPVRVTAPMSGTVRLRGALRTSDGTLIGQTEHAVQLTAGNQEVLLRFEGRQIHASGYSGYLQVSDHCRGKRGRSACAPRAALPGTRAADRV